MPDPGRTRTARWRARLRGLAPPLVACHLCPRQVRSARTAPLCSICWRQSQAGREWNRDRMIEARLLGRY